MNFYFGEQTTKSSTDDNLIVIHIIYNIHPHPTTQISHTHSVILYLNIPLVKNNFNNGYHDHESRNLLESHMHYIYYSPSNSGLYWIRLITEVKRIK